MAVKAPATTCRRDGSQSAEAQRSMPHETARTVPPGARVGGAPNRTLHGEAWARTAAMAQLLGRRWVGKHSAQHSSQARNTLSSTAFRERMHAATARNRFAGGLATTSECTLFGMGIALWLARHHSSRRNAHCGSRQTRHVLGSPQASRGCTRAAATRAGFTARSLRYSGQCAHYASVHTPSQHVLPARSSLGTYSSARARTPHSWLRSNTVLACIWLDAGAMRATSDRTHGPCCWRCVAVSDGSWFGAGHLMARPPMQYAPRPLVAHRNLGIRLARSRRRTIHRTHASKTTRAIFAGARCSLGVRVVRSWHYTRARRQQHACHVC